MNYEDLTDISNLAKAIGLSEDKLADLILAKVNEGWTNQEIADFLAGEMNADESAKGKAQNEMDALLGLGFNPSSNYNPAGDKRYEEYVEPVEEKGPGFWDTVKNGAKAVGGAVAYPFYKMYEGATDIDPLLQLGLVNAVWGDNSVLGMYNSNQQAEKNREAQKAYNSYWKELEMADQKAREDKEKEVSKKNARAKITELLNDYGYQTPQKREIIDKQIEALLKEAELSVDDVNTAKETMIENAKSEMSERSEKNKVLDPIRQEIRLHAPYSSKPDWNMLTLEERQAIQEKVGAKKKKDGTYDGNIGSNSIAMIEKWNKEHPEDQIIAPNALADILGRIDKLNYMYNNEQKTFTPAELDELRKEVYNGTDPAAEAKKFWEDFGRQNAKEDAEEKRKKDKLAKEVALAVKNKTKPSDLTKEVKDEILKGYRWEHIKKQWERK